jgi:hypothetical protein
MDDSIPDKPFRYEGFPSPNTTPVPDDVFDVLMPVLSEAELRVLLYVVRRTFGFKKSSDAISASQMVKGITTRDGRVLDRGTGLSKSAVWRGIAGLIDKGVLLKETRESDAGDSDVNIYALRYRGGVVLHEDYPSPRKERRVVQQRDTQETVSKNTDRYDERVRREQLRRSRATVGTGWLPPEDQ